MYQHFSILGIIVFISSLLGQGDPIKLIPVDAGVADRGALSGSLRVIQRDLRQNQSFEQLFKVSGSKDIYVRKAGGLRAVFRNSEYLDIGYGEIPIVPAGTVYCIGAIRPELLQQLGYLYEDAPNKMQEQHPPPPVKQVYVTVPQVAIPEIQKTIRFIDDETYRRKRLTSFVLDVVLQQQ